jgi:hypothetical protein
VNTARDELDPAGAGPEPIAGPPAWQVIHSGTADSARTPAARAVMRTSDGEFRITASHVDGKVGLTIEMLKADSAAFEPDGDAADLMNLAVEMSEALEPAQAAGGDTESDTEADAATEDHSPVGSRSPAVVRGVLSPTTLPRPRSANRNGREGRHSEAA